MPLNIKNREVERLVSEIADLTGEKTVKADLIKLRYFAGLTLEQAAQALDLPLRTAKRHYAYARAWLFREMTNGNRSET